MLAMVVVMAFEEVLHVSVLNAALIAAALMGLTRCLSAEQGRRSIEWPTLVTIGAALGVGKAIETSGLAGFAAKTLISGFLPMGPIGVLAAVYLLTLVFTELITNNAAAALAFPVAHATAAPLGYQTHLMVYGAGGYRFSDYVKIGVPLDLLIMLVTVTLTPYFFPFH
jgi:di/tricarboxylate transporter